MVEGWYVIRFDAMQCQLQRGMKSSSFRVHWSTEMKSRGCVGSVAKLSLSDRKGRVSREGPVRIEKDADPAAVPMDKERGPLDGSELSAPRCE